VLMNIVNGDVQRLVRLGPHKKTQEGLVPRMIPLRLVPEAEVKFYAEVMEIPFLEKHCPYRPRAHRLGFLEIINQMEEGTPGTRHSILSSYDQMIEPLRAHFPPAKLNDCSKCGEPTMGDICKACELLAKVKEALK
ncbi:MAG: TIGR00269 family protein, partial [Thermodesulfovibrionia bacterium]|nr:TIGR00269 family protein [Thermodesulfovibrionia bacterium]